jgi:rhodanese-related sulfurtransferase
MKRAGELSDGEVRLSTGTPHAAPERAMGESLVVTGSPGRTIESEHSQTKLYGSSVASVPRRLTSNGECDMRAVVHPLHLRSSEPHHGGGEHRSLERLVNEAAERITRFSAPDAFAASAADGLMIDIRSQDAREHDGVVPGSLHIPRTVLEWRVALDSPWRNIHLGGRDQQLILICDHGYSSILAASNLVELGFYRAGDVIGGFEAWKRQDLPTAPFRPRLANAGGLPGTDPPE